MADNAAVKIISFFLGLTATEERTAEFDYSSCRGFSPFWSWVAEEKDGANRWASGRSCLQQQHPVPSPILVLPSSVWFMQKCPGLWMRCCAALLWKKGPRVSCCLRKCWKSLTTSPALSLPDDQIWQQKSQWDILGRKGAFSSREINLSEE